MTNGQGETRFDGPKRTFPKPINLSAQVLLDRERCVSCARCTRFAEQIAGDPFIELLERGAQQQVGIAEGRPFNSYYSGNTFYAGNTQTGEIIKGNLRTGEYQRNWVPASPSQPSDLHRQGLGLLVDDHNRLWFAGSYGMACGGNNQPVCPAGVTSPAFNYGVAFVYDATTGAQLAQYTLTAATSKGINDMTISGNAVFFSNTTAPSGAGSEVQFKLQLGPGGALPPGDVPATAPRSPANPAVTNIPTPGFTGADGIDVLPNGNIIINSVNGASNGQMIVINATTLAVTPVTVTAAPTCLAGQCAPPLLSGDGVSIDGNTLYYPENRADTATPPGDIAAVKLMPPDYTTAQIVARLNSPAGMPPLRSPANTEQLGHLLYVISRELLPNPVTGVVNVTQHVHRAAREDPAAVLDLRIDRPDDGRRDPGRLPGRGGDADRTADGAARRDAVSRRRHGNGPDHRVRTSLGARLRLADHGPADGERGDGHRGRRG